MLLVLLAATACARRSSRVLNPTVAKNPVVYENDRAETIFERAVTRRYANGDAYIKQLKGMLSKNAYYNQQVVKADTDLDGIISEREAQRYADKKR